MGYLLMLCQFCEFDIPAEDIELSQRLAKCRGCNQVFTIGLAPVRIFHPSKPEKLKVVNENGIYYLTRTVSTISSGVGFIQQLS